MLKRKQLRHSHESQLDLFYPPRQTPAWPTLPGEVRGKVVTLLARLMGQHRIRSVGEGEAREVGDE